MTFDTKLKQALEYGPTQWGWRLICESLDELEGAPLDRALAEVDRQLADWPRGLRFAPRSWSRALIDAGAEPRVRAARVLNLTGVRGRRTVIERVSEAADIAQIEHLIFSLVSIQPKKMKLLAASPHLADVEAMRFSLCFIKDTGLSHLSKSTTIRALRELDLSNNDLGERGGKIVAKAKTEVFSNLESLWYDNNMLGDAGVGWLAGAELPALRFLSLTNNHVTAEGLAALAASTTLSGLRGLKLDDMDTRRVEDLDVLADTPLIERLEELRWTGHEERYGPMLARLVGLVGFGGLRRLEVRNQGLDDSDLEAIAKCAQMDKLRRLVISNATFTAGALATFAASPAARGLEELELDTCALDDEGVRALVSSPNLAGLRRLQLPNNPLTAASVEAIVEAPFAGDLEELELYSSPVGDGAARAIASASALSNLDQLRLSRTGITDEGAKALADAPQLSRLRALSLRQEGPFGKQAREALLSSPNLTPPCKSSFEGELK